MEDNSEFVGFLKNVVESSDNLSLEEMNLAVEAMDAYMKYERIKRRLQKG